jgi:hypothetical protein
MKLVIKTVLFNFICIFIFGLIYWFLTDQFVRGESFSKNNSSVPELIDHLFLSTTLQAGVGFSDLYPTTNFTKSLVILQQFIMISINVFMIYIFNV